MRSGFIAAATVIGLLACALLLYVASRRKVMAEDNTTGHVWDEDLRELNNPLPLWWVGLFVLTIVFAGVYLALYPGLGSHAGELRWSSVDEHRQESEAVRAEMAPVYARFQAMGVDDLARDAKAHGIGERLFANHCAGCHGSDAKGSKGFPNLTDKDWLWGGEFDTLVQTITQGRTGQMPPLAAAVGTSEDVRNVAHYVLSLSGSPHNAIAAQLGKEKFSVCAACHGPGGQGNQALGAPNLTDKVWLHGWGEAAVVAMVTQGKLNQMPAHGDKLSPEQIRVLAAYVWGMSNLPTDVSSSAPSAANK
jgi:cytochrome c oxidase cbb3-type subunit III